MYRTGKNCIYQATPITNLHSVQPRSDISLQHPTGAHQLLPGLLLGLGPNADNAFDRPGIEEAVRLQTMNAFGTFSEVQATIAEYFATVYHRLPIISKENFYHRLGSLPHDAPADFAALCLCIRLVLQQPSQQITSMQSVLYMTAKGVITLLESTNYVSIEILQARLLVYFYEIGHGISPANAISIGACARLARVIGLNQNWLLPVEGEARSLLDEEKRRVWWAVFNLDRYCQTTADTAEIVCH